ncbi:MAG: hypothetical protein JNM20_06770 [Rhizobiales bacterium]|nr:hypothetical protein [Hyphomicrobiales bacterium]
MNHSLPRSGLAPLLFLAVFLLTGLPAMAGYRDYAHGLVDSLPKGTVLRPDLEAVLDEMASAYRKSKSRSPLEASDQLREAARAQAIDNMRRGKSSHRSGRGEEFSTRFAAYVDDPDLYPARGENAASDRRDDAADAAKARRLFKSWLESSGHRRNLMSRDYEFVSTGVVQRGSELWAVQIFWSKPRAQKNIFQIQ